MKNYICAKYSLVCWDKSPARLREYFTQEIRNIFPITIGNSQEKMKYWVKYINIYYREYKKVKRSILNWIYMFSIINKDKQIF